MMTNEVDSNADLDIYAGLPDFKYSDKLEKLEKANASLTERVKSLERELFKEREEKSKYEALNKTLSLNISSLYKTAFSEIKRKDQMLDDLRKRFDNSAFRRRTNFSSKYTIQTHSTSENYVAVEGNIESRYQEEEEEEEINVKKIYLSHNYNEKGDLNCVESKQNSCSESLLLTEYSKRMHRRLLGNTNRELSADNQNSGQNCMNDQKCLPGINEIDKKNIDNHKPKENDCTDLKKYLEKKCDLCSPHSKCNCSTNISLNNKEIDNKNNNKFVLDGVNTANCILLQNKDKTVVKSIFDDDTLGSHHGDGFGTGVTMANAPCSAENVASSISNLEGVNNSDAILISEPKTTVNTVNSTDVMNEGVSLSESAEKGKTCLNPNKSHTFNNDELVNNNLTGADIGDNDMGRLSNIITNVIVLQKQDNTTQEHNCGPSEEREKFGMLEKNELCSLVGQASTELQPIPLESIDKLKSIHKGILDLKPESSQKFDVEPTSSKIDNPLAENLSSLIDKKPCDHKKSSSDLIKNSINSVPVVKASDSNNDNPDWTLIQIDMPLKNYHDSQQKNDVYVGNKNVTPAENVRTSEDQNSVVDACTKTPSNKLLQVSIKNNCSDNKPNCSKLSPKQNQEVTKFPHSKLLRKSKQTKSLFRPISLQWKSAALQKNENKTSNDSIISLKTHDAVLNHNVQNATNTSDPKTCKSKNNLLESLFGSALKWSDTDSIDEHKIDISSPTIYEDSCSAQLENPKFKVPLENNSNRFITSSTVNGIKKCITKEMTKNSHSFENHFVPEQKTVYICKGKMNEHVNAQGSVSGRDLQLDITTVQTDGDTELKKTDKIVYDKTPIKAKYDDSLLGQFEDTNQLISALTKVHETISPINTPLKEDKEMDVLSPVEKISDSKHIEITPTNKENFSKNRMKSTSVGSKLTEVISGNKVDYPVVSPVDVGTEVKVSSDKVLTGFHSLSKNVSENTSTTKISEFTPNKFQSKINILQPRKTPRNINSHKPKEPPKKISAFPQQKLNELSVLTFVKDNVKRRSDHLNNNDFRHGKNLLKTAPAIELSSVNSTTSKLEKQISSAAHSNSVSNNNTITKNSGENRVIICENICSSTVSVNNSTILVNQIESQKRLEGVDSLNVSVKVPESKLSSEESNTQVPLAKEKRDKYNINGLNKEVVVHVQKSENKSLNKVIDDKSCITKNNFNKNSDKNKVYKNTNINEKGTRTVLSVSPENKSKSLNNDLILPTVNHVISPDKKLKPVIAAMDKFSKKSCENSTNSKLVDDKQLSGRVKYLPDVPRQLPSQKRRVYRNSPTRKSDRERVDMLEKNYRSRNRIQRFHWRDDHYSQYQVKTKSHMNRECSSELLQKGCSSNYPGNDRYYGKFNHKRKHSDDDDRQRKKIVCQEIPDPNKVNKIMFSDDKIYNPNKITKEDTKNRVTKMEVCKLNKSSSERENNIREVLKYPPIQKPMQSEKSDPVLSNHNRQIENNQSRIIIRTSRKIQWSTTTNVTIQKCISDTDNVNGTKSVTLPENKTDHRVTVVSKNPSNGSDNGLKRSTETKEMTNVKSNLCKGKESTNYVKEKSTDNVQVKKVSLTTPEKVIVRKNKAMNFSESELTSTPTFTVKNLSASTPIEKESEQGTSKVHCSTSTPNGVQTNNQDCPNQTGQSSVRQLYPSVFSNSESSLSNDLRFSETSSSSCMSDETWRP